MLRRSQVKSTHTWTTPTSRITLLSKTIYCFHAELCVFQFSQDDGEELVGLGDVMCMYNWNGASVFLRSSLLFEEKIKRGKKERKKEKNERSRADDNRWCFSYVRFLWSLEESEAEEMRWDKWIVIFNGCVTCVLKTNICCSFTKQNKKKKKEKRNTPDPAALL